MSGGSWDYMYQKIEEAADRLCESKEPLRRAFGSHVRLVAKAMHDVEWVDSCDCSPGDERAAIERVLGKDAKVLELEAVKSDARKLIAQLNALVS